MLNEFLSNISSKNPHQEKYLKTAMEDITPEEIKKLENLFEFYVEQGDTMEEISAKYLTLIDFLVEEQKYFLINGTYRCSKYSEVEDLYKSSNYMESYVVGLGLSTYLWHIHRGLMRFFINHLRKTVLKGAYLEIGPGHGEYMVTAMQNTALDKYIAVDISKTSVDMTKKFINRSFKDNSKDYCVLHQDFFDFENEDKFNVVIMGEVLEHVENPLNFLNKIFEIADDNAFIYITTAINAPQPDHIYLFSNIEEIFNLFKQANFEIVDYIELTANNVPMEKAVKRKYAITVGFIVKKMK